MGQVGERLANLARIHQERSRVYGDDYVHVGRSLAAMFPRGIALRTPEQFRRFALFVCAHTKLNRYAQGMARDEPHADSLDDISVYAQIMRETDDEASGGG